MFDQIASTAKDHAPSAMPGVSSPPPAVGEVVRLLSILTVRLERLRGVVAGELHIGATDLRALYYVGSQTGVTPKQVAEQLSVTTGSVTPVLDRLETSGFLERLPNPNDRRSMLLGLTPAGRHARQWCADQYAHAVRAAIDSSPHLDTTLAVDLLIGLIASIDQLDADV